MNNEVIESMLNTDIKQTKAVGINLANTNMIRGGLAQLARCSNRACHYKVEFEMKLLHIVVFLLLLSL